VKALALALLMMLAPFAASAAEEAHEGAHAEGHDAAAAAEHRKEFIYEWVNVVILLAVLGYFARKPVSEYLASRRDTIAKNIASAEQLLRDAERKLGEWNERATRLDTDVATILESTRKSAEAERATILADAEATASRIRQGAAGVVERELRTARVTLRREAAELAVTLAGSLLREHTSEADRNRLVDEFIAKLESTPGSGGTH
jgi:F-type H+-transporting ATPase subunit b